MARKPYIGNEDISGVETHTDTINNNVRGANTASRADTSNTTSFDFYQGFITDGQTPIVDNVSKILEEELRPIDKSLTIVKFDKRTPGYMNLSYSVIVLALKRDNTVAYHPILLEETGEQARSVEEIVSALNGQNIGELIYLASDAFNKHLKAIIEDELSSIFTGNKLITCAGSIIKTGTDENKIKDNAKLYYNYLIGRLGIEHKVITPVDLRALVTRDTKLVLDPSFTNISTTVKENGVTTRVDFSLSLKKVPLGGGMVREPNLGVQSQTLITTTGYVDFLPDQNERGDIIITPQIIVNGVYTPRYEPSANLLGLINVLALTNEEFLNQLLLNVNRNIGSLNYIVNSENNESHYGEKLDFTKASKRDVEDFIYSYINNKVMIHLDIEKFGYNYSNWTPFINGDMDIEFINEVVESMTGINPELSRFTVDGEKRELPIGYFLDNENNKISLEEIDLIKVIELGNLNSITSYMNSIYQSGNGAYANRLIAISDVVGHGVIENKSIRLLLDPAALNVINACFERAGYKPEITGEGVYINSSNLRGIIRSLPTIGNVGFGLSNTRSGFNYKNIYNGGGF